MDQYPFTFKICFAGIDAPDFIDLLKNNGYKEQARTAQAQFDAEIKGLNAPTNSTELSIGAVGKRSYSHRFWIGFMLGLMTEILIFWLT